ncbi:MAG: hypothetical protein FJ279_38505, partial [Planctomycetes bacterium]|nr:hypothetical protein [Planctomycetota bacterium]
RGVGGLLPALEIADRQKTRDEVLVWSREAQLQYPGADDMGAEARQRMLEWELTGDEKPAYEALEACVRKMRLTFEAHTWGEPIDDRIWLPDHPLIVMMQGDMSHERNQLFPRHYVSYESFSDFAAWVREKSDDHLLLWLYSFASKPEDGKLRVWRAPFGQFRVTAGPDADADGQPDAGSKTRTLALHRFAAIPLNLPPRQLCAVRVDLIERSKDDFFARADLAIAAEDVAREGGALKVTVHNVGNRAAENVQIAVLSPDGRKLASQALAKLDAPLDLAPRRAEVRFTGLPSSALTLVLDADNVIPEINEDNNSVSVDK